VSDLGAMSGSTPREPDWPGLWALATRQFALGRHSVHGPDHWQRVQSNGLLLAGHTSGADVLIVRLFAVLHDSQRLSDGHDPDHGPRAAAWALQLQGDRFALGDEQLERLCHALTWHDRGQVSDDPTTGCCWDADRLDLPRVGIRPAPRFMSTPHGKRLAGEP
jgi:uncharacterized protein